MLSSKIMRHETEKRIEEAQNIESVLEYGKKLEVIEPSEFGDVYSPDEIKRDLEHLELAEKRIRESREKMSPQEREISEINEKRGKAFEILLADQIYDGEWLGSNAMSIRTSRFDDVLGGVDMIVEFDREDEIERMALAVDASTTSDMNQMERKIKRNIRRVTDDFWPLEVKYFQSQIANENGEYFKGGIENLIPVVVGADRRNADRIFDIFSELITLEKRRDDESKERRRWLREKLSRHPIQEVFFEQVRIQLEMYRSIIAEKGGSAKDVESLLNIIKEAEEERKELGFSSSEAIEGDTTLDNIRIIGQKYTRQNKGGSDR